MPLVAISAFPAEIGEIVEGHGGTLIANAGAFVAAGAEQRDGCELLSVVIPLAVRGTDQFAVVAPGIGVGIVVGRVTSVEAEAGGLADEVRANVSLVGFAVCIAMNLISHGRESPRSP
jgi:hypothetical protein